MKFRGLRFPTEFIAQCLFGLWSNRMGYASILYKHLVYRRFKTVQGSVGKDARSLRLAYSA